MKVTMIEAIFIDTSIFEAENFMEGHRINELFELSENEDIMVLMPEITLNEILHRLKTRIIESCEELNRKRLRDKTKVLRNSDSMASRFDEINPEEVYQEIRGKFEDKIKVSKIKIIPYLSIHTKEVFQKYFQEQPPFSGKKKNEFPDAFAIATIEKWCKEKHLSCLIFATDPDLNTYSSRLLKGIPNYKNYLNEKLEKAVEHQSTLKALSDSYIENKISFEKKVAEWVTEQFDNETLLYPYVDNMDIHSFNIEDISVELGDYQITRVHKESIYIQAQADVNFIIEVSHDDPHFVYRDDDTRELVYPESTVSIVNDSRKIFVDFIYAPPPAGDEFIELSVEQINLGNKL